MTWLGASVLMRVMSYLMIMRIDANADDLERVTEENGDAMNAIAQRGRDMGAIHHAFYVGDGEAVVVDEWDSPENFQRFFEAEQPNIGPLMAAAGVTGPPEIKFFRKLDTTDSF